MRSGKNKTSTQQLQGIVLLVFFRKPQKYQGTALLIRRKRLGHVSYELDFH